MPITLYRHPLSGHCHRVELMLRLLGLPFRAVDVDLSRGEHHSPGFLALNAFGQVPVLVDAGVAIADSNAILSYLALRHAAASWLPREPLAAARVQRWLSAAAGPLAYGAAAARAIRLFGQAGDRDEAIERAHALLRVMEHTLAADGNAFIAGAEPTIADLALYSYTAHAPEGDVSLDAYPAVRGWLRRVEALPGFVPMPASRAAVATA